MKKSTVHPFPTKPPAAPPRKPARIYRPADGERLQDGEASMVDYEVRIRLEGLAEPPVPPENELVHSGPPAWLPAIVLFLIGLFMGLFIASSVLAS